MFLPTLKNSPDHVQALLGTLRFEPGTIVVFDRAYNDYNWFRELDAHGIFFVTRMKEGADYGERSRRRYCESGQHSSITRLFRQGECLPIPAAELPHLEGGSQEAGSTCCAAERTLSPFAHWPGSWRERGTPQL